ncbi:hypothetical protein BDV19DRAFT_384101 [Aspergillus venezuelensis]
MAHSKRNTSLPHFTSYERSLLRNSWGTQRSSIGRDSFLPFGSCRLCLHPSRTPSVACAHNGDLFCRECAISDLLAQRKEIARLEKEREAARKAIEEETAKAKEEGREREVREFEMVSMGFDDRGNPKKRKVGDEKKDEEEMMRTKREKASSNKDTLPSFWVPSLTPGTDSNENILVKTVKLQPVCPGSTEQKTHSYSLKSLVDVHFTEEAGADGNMVRICPSCKKTLTNTVKVMLTKPCGHVICKPCVDKFMTPHDAPDPHASKEEQEEAAKLAGLILCYVCERDLTGRSADKGGEKEDKDKDEGKKKKKKKDKEAIAPGLVEISSEGTGFAGRGGSVASKAGVAFQC